MTASATPPDLPGYDFLRELGHGGFADVYLYRQHLPSREVAIKVMRQPAPSPVERAQFENEANRMAMLSSHPGIVTIYEVGVAPDDRPYITMEFCPHEHFGSIARAHPLTVARALEVGIKVAAAVETAHQAEILHRDIKPANILLTTYGEPALTDFGIAGGTEIESGAVSHGVSVPFAAPEVLNGSTVGDVRSDVYSLGATVYALLAGRSPFSTGAPTTEAELIQRTLNAPLPPTGRGDAPPTLERVLALALARDPANRYESAAAFGRALQGVEAELGLAQTPLRIADTSAVPPPRPVDPDDDDSTRFRSPQRVEAQPPPPPPPGAAATPPPPPPPPPPGAPPAAAPVVAWTEGAPVAVDGGLGDRTVHRGGAVPAPPSPPAGTSGAPVESSDEQAGNRRLILSVLGAVVVVGFVAFLMSRSGGSTGPDPSSTTTPNTSPLVTSGAPPRPESVRIEAGDDGGQVVTWSSKDEADGDQYQVFFTDGPDDLAGEAVLVEEQRLEVDDDDRICVTVETVRAGRVSDPSTEVCSP